MVGVNHCHCHRPAMLITSWTDLNPGRRFYGCQTARPHGCGYFMWYDPPMQPRAIQVIPGLLRRLRAIENEVQKFRRKERIYLIII